jgi:hypothetical protein
VPKSKRNRRASPLPPEKPKAATSVRRLLYSREQTCEALGGISISSVIRLEREGRLSKVRLRGLTGKVFNPVEDVEALASAVECADA